MERLARLSSYKLIRAASVSTLLLFLGFLLLAYQVASREQAAGIANALRTSQGDVFWILPFPNWFLQALRVLMLITGAGIVYSAGRYLEFPRLDTMSGASRTVLQRLERTASLFAYYQSLVLLSVVVFFVIQSRTVTAILPILGGIGFGYWAILVFAGSYVFIIFPIHRQRAIWIVGMAWGLVEGLGVGESLLVLGPVSEPVWNPWWLAYMTFVAVFFVTSVRSLRRNLTRRRWILPVCLGAFLALSISPWVIPSLHQEIMGSVSMWWYTTLYDLFGIMSVLALVKRKYLGPRAMTSMGPLGSLEEPMGDVIVGIPAFNESRSIGDVVIRCKRFAKTVIVVDDGSVDETARLAEEAGAIVLSHSCNIGVGGAMQTAMTAARILLREGGMSGGVFVSIDGDGQHFPEDIPLLVAKIREGYDVVNGSRMSESHEWYVRQLNHLASRIARWLSGYAISDSETGFRAHRQWVLQGLYFRSTDYGWNSEALIRLSQMGATLTEVPIRTVWGIVSPGHKRRGMRYGAIILARLILLKFNFFQRSFVPDIQAQAIYNGLAEKAVNLAKVTV